MRLILITHKNEKDVWATIHNGDQEEGDFDFVMAFLNGVKMQEKWLDEAAQQLPEGSKKKKIRFNKAQMKKDFDSHPGDGVHKVGPPGQVMKIIRNVKYCLPLRGPGGVVVYTCGGDGDFYCG